jgi:glycosyltransferase involved in cell wall biosynthesis
LTTYNQKHYIAKSIESILEQETVFDYEILIGDDGSSDGTEAICARYAEKYPDRIRFFRNSRKNVIHIAGQATGRFNFLYLVSHSRGKYIARLEGDDYWCGRSKLTNQVNFLERNPNYSICVHNTKAVFPDQPDKVKYFRPDWCNLTKESSTLEDYIKNGISYHTSSLVFRKEALPDPYPKWAYKVISGDMALSTILSAAGKTYYIDKIWSVYRVGAGITSKRTAMQTAVAKIDMFSHFDEYTGKKFSSHYDEKIKNAVYALWEKGGLLPFIFLPLRVILKYKNTKIVIKTLSAMKSLVASSF